MSDRGSIIIYVVYSYVHYCGKTPIVGFKDEAKAKEAYQLFDSWLRESPIRGKNALTQKDYDAWLLRVPKYGDESISNVDGFMLDQLLVPDLQD